MFAASRKETNAGHAIAGSRIQVAWMRPTACLIAVSRKAKWIDGTTEFKANRNNN